MITEIYSWFVCLIIDIDRSPHKQRRVPPINVERCHYYTSLFKIKFLKQLNTEKDLNTKERDGIFFSFCEFSILALLSKTSYHMAPSPDLPFMKSGYTRFLKKTETSFIFFSCWRYLSSVNCKILKIRYVLYNVDESAILPIPKCYAFPIII